MGTEHSRDCDRSPNFRIRDPAVIDRIYPVSGDPVSSTRSTYVQSFFHARLVYELFLLREGTYVPDPPDPRQIRPDLSGTGITGFPVFFRYPVDPVAVPTDEVAAVDNLVL